MFAIIFGLDRLTLEILLFMTHKCQCQLGFRPEGYGWLFEWLPEGQTWKASIIHVPMINTLRIAAFFSHFVTRKVVF
jgi:hypothetical protein